MSGKSILLVGLIIMAGVTLAPGFIWVDVQENYPEGTRIVLPVPVSFVNLGLMFAPNEALEEAASEVGPYAPLIEAACQELERIPDTVLVEVRDGQERVIVEKRGDKIYVDVEDRHDRVHVSFPVSVVSSVVGKITRAGTAAKHL